MSLFKLYGKASGLSAGHSSGGVATLCIAGAALLAGCTIREADEASKAQLNRLTAAPDPYVHRGAAVMHQIAVACSASNTCNDPDIASSALTTAKNNCLSDTDLQTLSEQINAHNTAGSTGIVDQLVCSDAAPVYTLTIFTSQFTIIKSITKHSGISGCRYVVLDGAGGLDGISPDCSQ